MRRKLGVVAAAFALAATMATTVSAAAPGDYPEYESWFCAPPAEKMPFTDGDWIPQGLTKWGEDRLVISYDHWDKPDGEADPVNSRLAIVDRATGRFIKWLRLDTDGHVGGLAMTSEWLWVATDGWVYRYKRSQLGKASGSDVYRSYAKNVKGAASYAFAEGETVWVGDFTSGNDYQWMYQYTQNADDELIYKQDRRTPSKVQGVALTPTKIIWSQSYGRGNPSKLIIWKRDEAYDRDHYEYGNVVEAPSMSEGLVILRNRLVVIYESGSNKYDGTGPGGQARDVTRRFYFGEIPNWTDGWGNRCSGWG